MGYTAPREELPLLARNFLSLQGAPFSPRGTIDRILMLHSRPMATHLINQSYVTL